MMSRWMEGRKSDFVERRGRVRGWEAIFGGVLRYFMLKMGRGTAKDRVRMNA
jgi:hypothetical protein